MPDFWKNEMRLLIHQVKATVVAAAVAAVVVTLYERKTERPFPVRGLGTDERVLRDEVAQRKKRQEEKKKKKKEDKKNKK